MNVSQSSQEHQKELAQELRRIVPILRDEYQAEKIIAFGSFVLGNINIWSDLDIAIIKPTSARFLDRLLEVNRLVGPGVSSDLLVYTPKEFDEMSQTNIFVQEEIIKKGKVLYDKNKSL